MQRKRCCERQFLLDHIDWLMREEFTILESALRLLLIIDNGETGKINYLIKNRKIS
jgi:hypothetical protein